MDTLTLARPATESLNDVRSAIPESCYRRSNLKAIVALVQAAVLYAAPIAGLVITNTWWMLLILWQEVSHAEVDEMLTRLTLHHDAAKTSGIHLSLAPIRRDRRSLLAKAVIGRVSLSAPNV